MDFLSRPPRLHILCFGGPGRPAAWVPGALRHRFAGSHLVEMLHDPGDVAGVIRTLERAGRRGGDEVEVIVSDAKDADAADAGLLRVTWPAACWVLVDEAEQMASDATAEELTARVARAIEEYRDRRGADLNAALARMELLHSLPPDRLAWIAERVELRRYEAGEVVMKAGEPGDGVYFIRSGEVKILDAEAAHGEHVIAGRGRGDHVGELALVTGQPRSHTVVTALDCELFFLRKAHYDQLMRAEPVRGVHLSRLLGARLAHAHHRHPETPRIIALSRALPEGAIPAAGVALAEAIAVETERAVALLELGAISADATSDALERAIGLLDSAGSLSRDDGLALGPGVWRFAGQRRETLRDVEQPGVLPGLLDLLIVAFDFVVVAVGPSTPGALMIRVAKQCDIFLLHVGRERDHLWQADDLLRFFHRDCPSVESKIAVMAEGRATGDNGGVALDRPVNFRLPAASAGRLDGLAHRRIARRVLGIAVGLSLGGGGARAAAHLGVLEVLEREEIPIDVVTGASSGAIIGGGYAMGRGLVEGIERWRRETQVSPFRRYTLSKTAVFSDRHLEAILRRLFEDTQVEDLALPFFAVATDLKQAVAVAIDRGPLWLAVRASCAVPGAVAPVTIGDAYLVDGGVADNVPADIARVRGARFVIAVDIGRGRGFDVVPHRKAPP